MTNEGDFSTKLNDTLLINSHFYEEENDGDIMSSQK